MAARVIKNQNKIKLLCAGKKCVWFRNALVFWNLSENSVLPKIFVFHKCVYVCAELLCENWYLCKVQVKCSSSACKWCAEAGTTTKIKVDNKFPNVKLLFTSVNQRVMLNYWYLTVCSTVQQSIELQLCKLEVLVNKILCFWNSIF